MAVCSFALTLGRTSVADATTPFLYDSSFIVFNVNTTTQDHLAFFTQPFRPLVYVATGGCLLTVLVLLVLLEMWQESLHTMTPGRNQRAFQRLMANSEIVVAGLLLKCELFFSLADLLRLT